MAGRVPRFRYQLLKEVIDKLLELVWLDESKEWVKENIEKYYRNNLTVDEIQILILLYK